MGYCKRQLRRRPGVEEGFPARLLSVIQDSGGLAARLIEADDLPWFPAEKTAALVECAQRALASMRKAFGPDPAGWTWGAVHRVHFRHPLSTSATADVFDVGRAPFPAPVTPSVTRERVVRRR